MRGRGAAVAALFATLLVGAGGCGGRLQTPPAERAPEALVRQVWTRGPGVYRLRQSVLFEYGPVRLPMAGFLELDTGRKRARLVAMDDFGVKLLDLTVSRDAVVENFVLPKLARPGLARAVGESVRRVFLSFEPEAGDALRRGPDGPVLRREEGRRELRFRLDPDTGALVEKRASGGGERWTVAYADFRDVDGTRLPARIVLRDRAAGYTLSLWLESGRRVHE